MNNQAFSKIGVLIVVIAVLVGGGILVWQLPWLPKEEVKPPEEKKPETEVKEETAVTVTMDIPKTSVRVGEEFEVNYSVETTKSPLYLVTTCRKQGFAKTCQMQEIMHGKIPLKYNQRVCEITDGMANCALDSFISPGTYIFEFEAYECDKITQKLGIVCDDVLRGWASEISKRHDDIVKQVAPIKFLKQEVIVLPKVEQ